MILVNSDSMSIIKCNLWEGDETIEFNEMSTIKRIHMYLFLDI